MTDYNDKHFCVLPWIHMHIWPNGITYPCCLATNDYQLGNTNDSSFQDLWNSEKMTALRKNILAGKPTSGCTRCYEHEKQGSRSMRQNMNMDYNHLLDRSKLTNEDGTVDDIHMAYMDVRFSNICNMRCRTCGPELSSQWVDDAVKMKRYPADAPKILKIKKTIEEFWSDVQPWIDTVERIYFAGGEPLIMDEHYKILEYLIEIGKTDIVIAYNTNFSKLTYKGKDVIELWKHFPNVRLGASLDAMGDRAEFMRKGTDWKQIEANIIRLQKEAPHVKFQVSATVSAYNVWHVADFFDEWVTKGYVPPQEIDINILLFPEYQQLQILPNDVRKEAKEKIISYMERVKLKEVDKNGRSYSAFNALVNTLDEDEKTEHQSEFRRQNRIMDNVRDEDLVSIFPELKGILYE